MKHFITKASRMNWLKLLPAFLLFLSTGRLVAQTEGGGEGGGEIDVNVDMDSGSDVWYTNWWIWIIGLAVFIIIIVAIVSAGKNRG